MSLLLLSLATKSKPVIFLLYVLIIILDNPSNSFACETRSHNDAVVSKYISETTVYVKEEVRKLNKFYDYFNTSLNDDGSLSLRPKPEYEECMESEFGSLGTSDEEGINNIVVQGDAQGNTHYYKSSRDDDGNEILKEIEKPEFEEESKNSSENSELTLSKCFEFNQNAWSEFFDIGRNMLGATWSNVKRAEAFRNEIDKIPCDTRITNFTCISGTVDGKTIPCNVTLERVSGEAVNSDEVAVFLRAVQERMEKRRNEGPKKILLEPYLVDENTSGTSSKTTEDEGTQEWEGNFYKSVGEFEEANPDVIKNGDVLATNLDVNNDGSDDIVSVTKNAGGEELLMDTDGDGQPDMKSITYSDGRPTEYVDLSSPNNGNSQVNKNSNEFSKRNNTDEKPAWFPQTGSSNKDVKNNLFTEEFHDQVEQSSDLLEKASAGFNIGGQEYTSTTIGVVGEQFENINTVTKIVDAVTSGGSDQSKLALAQDIVDRAASLANIPARDALMPFDLLPRTYKNLFNTDLMNALEGKEPTMTVTHPLIDWLGGTAQMGSPSEYLNNIKNTKEKSLWDIIKEDGLYKGLKQNFWNNFSKDKK